MEALGLTALDAPKLPWEAAVEALELVSTPILLVGAALDVLFANAAARAFLARGDGLHTMGTRVCAVTVEATRALRGVVLEASRASRSCARAEVLLPRQTTSAPLIATIAPLHGHDGAIAALFVADPEDGKAHRANALARMFALTAAEAKVAVLVAEGHGVAHVAELLGVSCATVRTHLQHVFGKSGTHRQAELAGLVTRVLSQCPGGPEAPTRP